MGGQKYGPESTHEERVHRRLHILYTRKTHERRIFMNDLHAYRQSKEARFIRAIKSEVGPKWYQTLSVPQRSALDRLEFSNYQDLLEGRPIRTSVIMKQLGLFPRPNTVDLMNCLYAGRDDPKQVLAQLYLTLYGYPIDGKRISYELNARLILSAIFYLGLNNLIELLKERFRPDPQDDQPKPKPKPKPEPPLPSPYLQKMVAVLYTRPVHKPAPPPPLPNLDDLNEPYEEEPVIPKPPPPPPPPPPPKKRLPRSYCDKVAGVNTIQPYSPPGPPTPARERRTGLRKLRSSKMSGEGKKTYGLGLGCERKAARGKKPVAPKTSTGNAQYTINGVYVVREKIVYVLGNIVMLSPAADLIHGGFKSVGEECINIHCGFRAFAPPPKPDHCDCLKTWHGTVLNYLKENKCNCGHSYDYKNEGTFPPEELPFFVKPTRDAPMKFNYETIFEIDPKRLHVDKEFKTLWDTDSVLHEDDGTNIRKVTKKKKKKSSTTCLGEKPKPEDYLKCALRLMRRVNVAARLPDLYLVPELKEWMRRRIYGPITRRQKAQLLSKSLMYWQVFDTLANRGYEHVSPPKDHPYSGVTNWSHKQQFRDMFKKYTFKYRLQMFRLYAYVTNLFWPSMCQAQLPDKKFREIYFSYLYGRVEDLQLMHPYSMTETLERKCTLAKRRYVCLPAGLEQKE